MYVKWIAGLENMRPAKPGSRDVEVIVFFLKQMGKTGKVIGMGVGECYVAVTASGCLFSAFTNVSSVFCAIWSRDL